MVIDKELIEMNEYLIFENYNDIYKTKIYLLWELNIFKYYLYFIQNILKFHKILFLEILSKMTQTKIVKDGNFKLKILLTLKLISIHFI